MQYLIKKKEECEIKICFQNSVEKKCLFAICGTHSKLRKIRFLTI